MYSIHFSHPQYLYLLPLVWAFTWWVIRDSLADLGRARARLSATLRALLLSLLVLALAGAQLVRPTTTLCTVFAVDVSDSIQKSQQAFILDYIRQATRNMRRGDTAALVAFGGEALLDQPIEETNGIKKIATIVSTPSTSRTDIAAGIQVAMASFPQESGKQIVLFSDGNENLGNALDQAGLALANDVRISIVPLKRDTVRGEALLLHAEVPAESKEGAPFQVSVLAEALQDTDGLITLYRNNTPVETRKVHLKPGKTVVAFEQKTERSGLYHYRALLEVPGTQDSVPDNNVAYAYTRVAGKPKLLIVEGTPGDGAPLATALRARSLQVELGGVDRIPASLAECTQYDSVLFANVPAWNVSPTQMLVLRSAVRDTGMGFAMVGGEESFGAGGYYQTPIEDILPLSLDVKKIKRFPSVAVVMVIEYLEDQRIIDTSIEAAKQMVDLLEPIDYLGVEDCNVNYGSTGWQTSPGGWPIKLQRVHNRKWLKKEMNKLTNMGDPPGYSPMLLEAARVLKQCPAPVKHIILVGDGDAQGDCNGNAAQDQMRIALNKIRRMDITVSAISNGVEGKMGLDYMRYIAHYGGGKAYEAKYPEELPKLLMRDQQSISKPPLVEEPFHVRVNNAAHPAARGIPWGASPPLLGYVATTSKASRSGSAQLLLTSHKDDPILAAGPFGLGRSIAFTSDATAHWGAHWLNWEGYGAFWAQALRWSMRRTGKADFQTTLLEDHGRATISVDAVTPEGNFRNLLDLRAHVTHVQGDDYEGPRVTREVLPLQETVPGRYEAQFDARGTGIYLVTVEERENGTTKGMQMATLTIPYSPEFQSVHPNLALLAQVAGRTKGEEHPRPDAIYQRLRFGSQRMRDIWPALLLLLALLFLLDVALRRILLPWGTFFTVVRQVITARLPVWQAATAPAGPATLGTLLNVKGATRQSRATAPRLPHEHAGELQTPAPSLIDLIPDDTPVAKHEAPVTTVNTLLQQQRERKKK